MDSTLDSNQDKPSRLRRAREHLAQDVTESWADAVLMILCFVTGLIDSAVFNVWSCFVSMQTGNTIYVGLGFSGQPLDQPYRWTKSLTAILCFSIGVFVFSRFVRMLGPLRRSTMFLSFGIQAALCLVSAALVATSIVPRDAGTLPPKNFIVLLPLGLLSFQSAGQIVMSRMLEFSELTTVVLTSTYCDLMMDPQLITAELTADVKRNRRVISVFIMVAGAIAGGFLTRGGSIEICLWIGGAMKMVIAFGWLFWKSQGAVHLD